MAINTPKPLYNVNDTVKVTGTNVEVKVTGVNVVYRYEVRTQRGVSLNYMESELAALPKLTEDETWTDIHFLIPRMIEQYGLPVMEDEYRRIRQESYKVLYSNGHRVTDEAKARVRKIYERALAQAR
jgi:hypothetical protein